MTKKQLVRRRTNERNSWDNNIGMCHVNYIAHRTGNRWGITVLEPRTKRSPPPRWTNDIETVKSVNGDGLEPLVVALYRQAYAQQWRLSVDDDFDVPYKR